MKALPRSSLVCPGTISISRGSFTTRPRAILPSWHERQSLLLPSGCDVIPPKVELKGTVRTYTDDVMKVAEERMRAIVEGIPASHGGKGELLFKWGYPATINAERETGIAAKVIEDLVGADKVDHNPTPSMGGEDFAYMLNKKPGSYVWIGNGLASPDAMLHNPGYDFNDEVIPLGVSYWSRLVETQLG